MYILWLFMKPDTCALGTQMVLGMGPCAGSVVLCYLGQAGSERAGVPLVPLLKPAFPGIAAVGTPLFLLTVKLYDIDTAVPYSAQWGHSGDTPSSVGASVGVFVC